MLNIFSTNKSSQYSEKEIYTLFPCPHRAECVVWTVVKPLEKSHIIHKFQKTTLLSFRYTQRKTNEANEAKKELKRIAREISHCFVFSLSLFFIIASTLTYASGYTLILISVQIPSGMYIVQHNYRCKQMQQIIVLR